MSSDEEDEEVNANVVSLKFDGLKALEQGALVCNPISCKSCGGCFNKYSKLLPSLSYIERKKRLLDLAQKKAGGPPPPGPEKMEEEEKVEPMMIEKPEEKKEMEEELPLDLIGEELNADIINQKYIEEPKGKAVWICEFCDTHNEVAEEGINVPSNDLVYALEPNPKPSAKSSVDEGDETSLIFCMDTSGSMSVTTEVEGEMELQHGLTHEEYEMLKKFMDPGESQLLPNQAKNKTWVSRKQCVVGAMEKETKRLADERPKSHVGLITFNDTVQVIGDGGSDAVPVKGGFLADFDQVFELGQNIYESKMNKSVQASLNSLMKEYKKIKEGGQTALGPAVLCAVALASRGKTGSKVVLCTDGLANVGLGALDPTKVEESNEFYERVGSIAKDLGVTISVITIKGEGCAISVLSKLTSITNGTMLLVNPADISKDLSNIMKEEILGTKGMIKFRLHRAMKFKNVDEDSVLKENGSMIEKDIGNLKSAMELTFEYDPKRKEELENEGIQIDKRQKEIPFQVQINYLNSHGKKQLRVVTMMQKLTAEENLANKNMDLGIIGAHAQKVQARMARKKSFDRCQKYGSKYENFLENNYMNADTSQIASNKKKLATFQTNKTKIQTANVKMQHRAFRKQEEKAPKKSMSSLVQEQLSSDEDNYEVEQNLNINSENFK